MDTNEPRSYQNIRLQKESESCVWKGSIKLDHIYNITQQSGTTGQATCELADGEEILIELKFSHDPSVPITTTFLTVKVPWRGEDVSGDPAEYEVLDISWKQEMPSCEMSVPRIDATLGGGQGLPGQQLYDLCYGVDLTVDITGNAGFDNIEGIFNQANLTAGNCENLRMIIDYLVSADAGDAGDSRFRVGCDSKGACCLPNGDCETIEKAECEARGGKFWGASYSCEPSGLGNTKPNPCTEPQKGSCCELDGTCSEVSEADCNSVGGTWTAGGSCSPNPCDTYGRCCDPSNDCSVITEADCNAISGTWDGTKQDCSEGCVAGTTGACCLPNGSCTETTSADCTDAGGTYQGDSTTCTSSTCDGCEHCLSPPASVLLTTFFQLQTKDGCNCQTDLDGNYIMTPESFESCIYSVENSVCGGKTLRHQAILGSFNDGGIQKAIWSVSATYDGEVLIPATSFVVPCEGGSQEKLVLLGSNSFCDQTIADNMLFIVNP